MKKMMIVDSIFFELIKFINIKRHLNKAKNQIFIKKINRINIDDIAE
jgi:hypothetical protein